MADSLKENKTKKRDAFSSALGGVNSGAAPNLIAPNSVAFAFNVTLRGGYPETRPGFIPSEPNFDSDEIKSWFKTHRCQGVFPYESDQGNFQIALVGGRFFKVDPLTHFMVSDVTPTLGTTTVGDFTSPAVGASVTIVVVNADKILVNYPLMIGDGHYMVTDVTLNTLTLTNLDATPAINVLSGAVVLFLDPNNADIETAYSVQIAGNRVFQDGQSLPVIYDGSSAKRTEIETGIPVGTAMAVQGNRLWVAIGEEVAAGDILVSGEPDSAMHFTEEKLTTGGGGRFRVEGKITAMVVAAALDVSLGQGPLLVMTRDSFNSFNLPTNRDLWNQITAPIQTIALQGFGPLGQNSVVVVNSDVFYRAKDGLRSFVMARREFFTWGNVPISREMKVVLDDETRRLRKFSSATLFDNRLLFGVTPRRYAQGTASRGLGVLDFDLISSMGQKQNAVYDGLWAGIETYHLITMDLDEDERCFAYTREVDGSLGIWEISRNADYDGINQPIGCYVEFRAFSFTNNFMYKKLQSAKIWVDRMAGQVDFTLKWRPDDQECWFVWGTRSFCVKAPCASGDCYSMKTAAKAYVTRKGFGQPPDVCDGIDQKLARYCYECQPRLEWVGKARLKRLLLTADEFDEHPISDCD